MRVVGIIAEYNPLHNGHIYHLEQAKRKTGASYCVVIMSGNFVQRVEKNRTERDILFRFLVEVTGFEPATFWSRKPVHASIIVRLGPILLPEK